MWKPLTLKNAVPAGEPVGEVNPRSMCARPMATKRRDKVDNDRLLAFLHEPDLPQRSELLQALITRNIRALEHWANRYWQHLSETALRVFDGAHRHCQVA